MEKIGYDELIGSLNKVELTPEDIDSLIVVDKNHPYGRNVIIDNPRLEVMVATWNKKWRCAPHDHGNVISAILVLRGCSDHYGYSIKKECISVAFQEYKKKGEILTCDPQQVHSMSSATDETLITLHCYSEGIEKMVLYDIPNNETIIVPGTCGAWLPVDEPSDICRRESGFLTPQEICQTK